MNDGVTTYLLYVVIPLGIERPFCQNRNQTEGPAGFHRLYESPAFKCVSCKQILCLCCVLIALIGLVLGQFLKGTDTQMRS